MFIFITSFTVCYGLLYVTHYSLNPLCYRLLILSLQESVKRCYCIDDVSRHEAVSSCSGCGPLYPRCGKTKDRTAAVYARQLKINGKLIKYK